MLGRGTWTSRTPYQIPGVTPDVRTSALTVDPVREIVALAVPLVADGRNLLSTKSQVRKRDVSGTKSTPFELAGSAAADPAPATSIAAAVVAAPAAAIQRVS
jgi:hypothetical protein